MRCRFLCCVMLIIMNFFMSPCYAVKLIGWEGQAFSESSVFKFVLSSPAKGEMSYIAKDHLLTLAFHQVTTDFPIKPVEFKNANVKSMTVVSSPSQMRFLFDVTKALKPHVEYVKDPQSHSVKVVLTLLTDQEAMPTSRQTIPKPVKSIQLKKIQEKAKLVSKMTGSNQLKTNVQKSSVMPHPMKKPFIVVIDAGHGGRDAGAIGADQIREKDIVLSISKKLAMIVNKQPNMRAVLTRKGDYFVPLRKRLALARKGDADIFIAIHADAYFNYDAHGASVYALSERGATSEAARWLAQKDNFTELDSVELNALKDKSPFLRSTLIDLAQTATIQDSLQLGKKVLNSLKSMTTLHRGHVEQAPFVVLKSPDIPSVLVETGFITYPNEAKRLSDPDYQTMLAQAIFQGIQSYHLLKRDKV